MSSDPIKVVESSVETVVSTVDGAAETVQHTFEQTVAPLRRSIFYRYPILFTIVVAFGVTTTLVGFELVLMEWTYVYERPWLVLLLGLSILVATGTLYKKLR